MLDSSQRTSGTCPDYISELIELNTLSTLTAASIAEILNTRGANLNVLPRRYNRAKEDGRTFSVTTSKCWNHLPLK